MKIRLSDSMSQKIKRALQRLGDAHMQRVTIRVLLSIALALSLCLIVISLVSPGHLDMAGSAVVAAALAVIASVMAAWATQTTVELEQDAKQPYPYPFIDGTSRYSLLQLRVRNLGGSIALNIRLKWDRELLNTEGSPVRFGVKEISEVPVLLPGESASTLIGGGSAFLAKYPNTDYSGEIEFCNASGTKMRHRFFISAESYRTALVFEQEEPKTHHEIQRIPERLKELTAVVGKIRNLLESADQPTEKPERR